VVFCGEFSHNLYISNKKKFYWLIRKKEQKNISKVKDINYQIYIKKDTKVTSYKLSDSGDNNNNYDIFNISIDHYNFKNRNNFIISSTSINEKWFI